jgi:hypothetical protein
MLSQRFVTSAFAAAAMFATFAAVPVRAQEPLDARTEFTFNQPVELPGVTLPPGTYIFRFADATASRKVMQVLAKDASNKTYGLFLTISAQRPQPSDDAELRFIETPAGQPAAVKTWWYPGRTIGREFIYPKSQARKLAQANNTTVLTTHDESVSNEQMQSADLAYMGASGQETPLTDEQLVAAAENTAPVGSSTTAQSNQSGVNAQASAPSTPAPSPSPSASAAQSAPAPTSDRAPVRVGERAGNTADRTSLPRTSTFLPLIGLLGGVSLLGGALRWK